MIVSPSVLSADFLHLARQIKEIERTDARWLHYDVMDGHFVPNLSFGPGIFRQIAGSTDLFLDVHLMVTDPLSYIADFDAADLIFFHLESGSPIQKTIAEIHGRHIKAGLALKPANSVEALLPYLDDIEAVLVMSVEPGFGGQTFMMSSLDKIKALRALKKDHDFLIAVDGGINDENAPLVKAAGADVVVAGSYIFGAPDKAAAVAKLL